MKDQVGTTKALIENIDGMPQVTNRYIFGPFGEPLSQDISLERQGFIGKERDLESGLADHGVRKYDYISGRFISVDPFSEKFYGWTPYQYSYNNPISFLDDNGLLPGDLFSTPEIAAHDFGKNYNPISIQKNKELVTEIYKINENGKSKYTYTIPIMLNNDGGTIQIQTDSDKLSAIAHTHGAYDPKYLNNYFSPDDVNTSQILSIPIFVVTPSGSLQRFNPIYLEVKVLYKDMPRDIKDAEARYNIKEEIFYDEKRPIQYYEQGIKKEFKDGK